MCVCRELDLGRILPTSQFLRSRNALLHSYSGTSIGFTNPKDPASVSDFTKG